MPQASFRPHFTLLVLYFFGFFLLFCFLLILPAMIEGAAQLPVGPGELTEAEKQRGAAIAREALRGKLPIALLATVAAVGLGSWKGVLPGLRRR
jgi:hypothetical protein